MPTNDDRTKNERYIYKVEYWYTLEKTEMILFKKTWMQVEIILIGKIGRSL